MREIVAIPKKMKKKPKEDVWLKQKQRRTPLEATLIENYFKDREHLIPIRFKAIK